MSCLQIKPGVDLTYILCYDVGCDIKQEKQSVIQRINEIINGKRGMTPSTALRLEKFLGMSASFWLNLQLRWDLYFAQRAEQDELATITPYPMADAST